MKKIFLLSIVSILFATTSISSSLAHIQAKVDPVPNLNKGKIAATENLSELDDFMNYIKKEIPKNDGREVVTEGIAVIRGKNVKDKKQGVKIPVESGYGYTFISVNYGSDTHEVTIVRGSDNAVLTAGIKDGVVASSSRVNSDIFYSNIDVSSENKLDTIYFIPKGEWSGKVRWVLMRKKYE
jgi:hypothetical protein